MKALISFSLFSPQYLRDNFLAGFPVVKIAPYLSPMRPILGTAQGILINPKTAEIVMSAATWGKGRVLAYGDSDNFDCLCGADRKEFWPKIAHWLGFGQPVKCIKAEDAAKQQ